MWHPINYGTYAGPYCQYLHLRFTNPTKDCLYIRILKNIMILNLDGFFPHRNDVLEAVGIQKKINGRHSDYQYFKALTEANFIVNVGLKNSHKYAITDYGRNLIKKALKI